MANDVIGKRFYDKDTGNIITTGVSLVRLKKDGSDWVEDTLYAPISATYNSTYKCFLVEIPDTTSGNYAWKIGSAVQGTTAWVHFGTAHTHSLASHTHSEYEKTTFLAGAAIISALAGKQLEGGCIQLEATTSTSGEFTYFFEYWQTTTETTTGTGDCNDTWWSGKSDKIIKQTNSPEAVISLEPDLTANRKLYARCYCRDVEDHESAKSSTIAVIYNKNAGLGFEALVDSITARIQSRLEVTAPAEGGTCTISDKETMT